MNNLWHEIRALLAEQCLTAALRLMPNSHKDAPALAAALGTYARVMAETRINKHLPKDYAAALDSYTLQWELNKPAVLIKGRQENTR